jgi:hypothetical protein
MAISNLIERLGRAIFEAPFSGGLADAPELAEVRLAVVDAVKAKSHRAGGRLVFPFNLVEVRLRGVPGEQAAAFESDLLASYLAEEIKRGLDRSSHRFRPDLTVRIHAIPDLPLENESWIDVEARLERPVEGPESAAPQPAAKLTVIQGKANRATLPLTKGRTNIGRSLEVFRSSGPSRKNDLAFTDETEINRTVSREHAHIIYDPASGEYRIFNDRWYRGHANCGLWLVRDGLSIAVQRSTRGTLLHHGDEIHLGSAILRFIAK